MYNTNHIAERRKEGERSPFGRLPFLLSLLALLLSGCIPDPVVPDRNGIETPPSGIIVVNQGVWRGDNGSLTFYDTEGDTAYTDWFSVQNEGLRIGDTGNDIVVRGDRAYVAVSGSAAIEILSLPEGESIGRVRFPAGAFPQHLTILNDSVGWASSLDDDAVYQFHPTRQEVLRRVPVGPAPEGIAVAAGRLFVANSGLGALRRDEPGAGTISVIDPQSGVFLDTIDLGGNLRDLHYLPLTGRLYCFIGAPLPDTAGSGLVEIDPVRLNLLRRWSVSGAWEVGFDDAAGVAYLIAQEGVVGIELNDFGALPGGAETFPFIPIPLSTLNEEVPHSIAVSTTTGEVLIGVARGYYSAPGRVDRYDYGGKFLGSFPTGLNPAAFGFVR